jgi:hypothetical protein
LIPLSTPSTRTRAKLGLKIQTPERWSFLAVSRTLNLCRPFVRYLILDISVLYWTKKRGDSLVNSSKDSLPLFSQHLLIFLLLPLLDGQFSRLVVVLVLVGSRSDLFSNLGLDLCWILYRIGRQYLHQIGQSYWIVSWLDGIIIGHTFWSIRRQESHLLPIPLILKLGFTSLPTHLLLFLLGQHQSPLVLLLVARCRDWDRMLDQVRDQRFSRVCRDPLDCFIDIIVCRAVIQEGHVPPLYVWRWFSLSSVQLLTKQCKIPLTFKLLSRVSNSLSRPAFLLAAAILCLRASILASFLNWSPCSTYLPCGAK